MVLIEIMHFNPAEFKILEGEIKARNMFYNENNSKKYGQDTIVSTKCSLTFFSGHIYKISAGKC